VLAFVGIVIIFTVAEPILRVLLHGAVEAALRRWVIHRRPSQPCARISTLFRISEWCSAALAFPVIRVPVVAVLAPGLYSKKRCVSTDRVAGDVPARRIVCATSPVGDGVLSWLPDVPSIIADLMANVVDLDAVRRTCSGGRRIRDVL
jgi:hypothetical protein